MLVRQAGSGLTILTPVAACPSAQDGAGSPSRGSQIAEASPPTGVFAMDEEVDATKDDAQSSEGAAGPAAAGTEPPSAVAGKEPPKGPPFEKKKPTTREERRALQVRP